MIPADRVYADPGGRWVGRYDPPRRCVVVTQWGPANSAAVPASVATVATATTKKTGPRNVAVRYLDDSSMAVIPFSRRLRRAKAEWAEQHAG